MKKKRHFLPGFLFDFPHAKAFKGGGAPAMPPVQNYNPPTPYVPPTYTAPTSGSYNRTRGDITLDQARANYIASQDYSQYGSTDEGYAALGGDAGFVDWWKNNAATTKYSDFGADEDLLYALAVGGNQDAAGILGYAPKTGTGTTGTGTEAPPVTPPSPDAPVTSPNGQTVFQPTPTQPIPPVSDRSSEVMQAGREARRAAKKRKGLLSTYLAGETGGATGAAPTLLGRSNT